MTHGWNDKVKPTDEGQDAWYVDNGAGAGLEAITTGSGGVLDATYLTTSAHADLTAEVLTTAMSTDFIPDADGTRDLGSSTSAWAELYADAIKTTSGTALDIKVFVSFTSKSIA